MTRSVLPNRRYHEVREFELDRIRYTVGISRFPDGSPSEVFMNSNKAGSAADTNARDAAILMSFLFQHGVNVGDFAPALARGTDGKPLGPIGIVAEMLQAEIEGSAS
jgi:hypothetical protein